MQLWNTPDISIAGGFQDPTTQSPEQPDLSSDLNPFELEAGIETLCNPFQPGLSYDNLSLIAVKESILSLIFFVKNTTKNCKKNPQIPFKILLLDAFSSPTDIFCLSPTEQQARSKKWLLNQDMQLCNP